MIMKILQFLQFNYHQISKGISLVSNLYANQVMIFLLQLPLIHASSYGQNSNSALSNHKVPAPLVFESACLFLSPLANYSLDSSQMPFKEGMERLNLPLVKSSREKINFLIVPGKKLSYNILGQEHNYEITQMKRSEKYFNCDCLANIESPGTFLEREWNKICTEVDCDYLSLHINLRKEVISLLSKYKLASLSFERLSDFVGEGIFTSQEFDYIRSVKEKGELHNQVILDSMQATIISRVKEDLILSEKDQIVSCEMPKKYGKFLDFHG